MKMVMSVKVAFTALKPVRIYKVYYLIDSKADIQNQQVCHIQFKKTQMKMQRTQILKHQIRISVDFTHVR